MSNIHLQPPTFEFPIVAEYGRIAGYVCFQLVEVHTPVKDKREDWEYPPNPNIPTLSYVTRNGLLRANICKLLDVPQRRIHRAFVGAGTEIHAPHKGNGYGREAMRLFLDNWASIADIVVIRAFPINPRDPGPGQKKLAQIWQEVGFKRRDESSFTLFYSP